MTVSKTRGCTWSSWCKSIFLWVNLSTCWTTDFIQEFIQHITRTYVQSLYYYSKIPFLSGSLLSSYTFCLFLFGVSKFCQWGPSPGKCNSNLARCRWLNKSPFEHEELTTQYYNVSIIGFFFFLFTYVRKGLFVVYMYW